MVKIKNDCMIDSLTYSTSTAEACDKLLLLRCPALLDPQGNLRTQNNSQINNDVVLYLV